MGPLVGGEHARDAALDEELLVVRGDEYREPPGRESRPRRFLPLLPGAQEEIGEQEKTQLDQDRQREKERDETEEKQGDSHSRDLRIFMDANASPGTLSFATKPYLALIAGRDIIVPRPRWSGITRLWPISSP
jgi:hypothetical protein